VNIETFERLLKALIEGICPINENSICPIPEECIGCRIIIDIQLGMMQ
jgi:hypothetical protein